MRCASGEELWVHLTPTEKKHVKLFLESKFISAKVGPRKRYQLINEDRKNHVYTIRVSENVTDASVMVWNKDKTKLINKSGVAQSTVKVKANIK